MLSQKNKLLGIMYILLLVSIIPFIIVYSMIVAMLKSIIYRKGFVDCYCPEYMQSKEKIS